MLLIELLFEYNPSTFGQKVSLVSAILWFDVFVHGLLDVPEIVVTIISNLLAVASRL